MRAEMEFLSDQWTAAFHCAVIRRTGLIGDVEIEVYPPPASSQPAISGLTRRHGAAFCISEPLRNLIECGRSVSHGIGKVGRSRATFRRNRSKSSQPWSSPCTICSKSGDPRPKAVETGSNLARGGPNLYHTRPNLGRDRPKLINPRAGFGSISTDVDENQHIWARIDNVGPSLTEFGHFCLLFPHIGEMWWDFVPTWTGASNSTTLPPECSICSLSCVSQRWRYPLRGLREVALAGIRRSGRGCTTRAGAIAPAWVRARLAAVGGPVPGGASATAHSAPQAPSRTPATACVATSYGESVLSDFGRFGGHAWSAASRNFEPLIKLPRHYPEGPPTRASTPHTRALCPATCPRCRAPPRCGGGLRRRAAHPGCRYRRR